MIRRFVSGHRKIWIGTIVAANVVKTERKVARSMLVMQTKWVPGVPGYIRLANFCCPVWIVSGYVSLSALFGTRMTVKLTGFDFSFFDVFLISNVWATVGVCQGLLQNQERVPELSNLKLVLSVLCWNSVRISSN